MLAEAAAHGSRACVWLSTLACRRLHTPPRVHQRRAHAPPHFAAPSALLCFAPSQLRFESKFPFAKAFTRNEPAASAGLMTYQRSELGERCWRLGTFRYCLDAEPEINT